MIYIIVFMKLQMMQLCILQVGVISCSDNSPTNHYLYLVCVVTGWWKDAGTSANVFLFLKGLFFFDTVEVFTLTET